jgi:CDP-diacylglycerol--glycerol-3-phosphate 3-phosphatidyltransferase
MRKYLKKRIRHSVKTRGENIYNLPNSLTLLRVVITFILVYLIFAGARIEFVIILFIIGMFTDMADGQIARRFNLKTEFGRKFDPIADRFLMISTVICLVLSIGMQGLLTRPYILAILLVMAREIIAFPFALFAFTRRRALPQVKFIGKLTTVMQAIAFPAVILNIYYPQYFWFSTYLAFITAICGIFAAFTYIFDVMGNSRKRR